MDLELVAIPGLRTLTARLPDPAFRKHAPQERRRNGTHRLAGRDLKDLGGEADGALDTELLVLGTVDEVRRDYRCPAVSTGAYCVKR